MLTDVDGIRSTSHRERITPTYLSSFKIARSSSLAIGWAEEVLPAARVLWLDCTLWTDKGLEASNFNVWLESSGTMFPLLAVQTQYINLLTHCSPRCCADTNLNLHIKANAYYLLVITFYSLMSMIMLSVFKGPHTELCAGSRLPNRTQLFSGDNSVFVYFLLVPSIKSSCSQFICMMEVSYIQIFPIRMFNGPWASTVMGARYYWTSSAKALLMFSLLNHL